MFESLIVIAGLALFEIVSSVDNAIVNAHVLKTIPERYRRFFLVWGLLLAVVVMRGVLPFLIVYLANGDLSMWDTVTLAFTDPKLMEESLHESKPLLLIGGGMYLWLVFLAWLFNEEKKYAFLLEHFIHRQSVWFNSFATITLAITCYYAITAGHHVMMPFAAMVGATAFFITEGFRANAEHAEESLHGPNLSAWSKLLYLEVLDASFSIDGVIGAFAFTMSVPLILAGNGVGALVVREVTVRGLDIVSKFAYLKNGAMYSIGLLGALMLVESFGFEPPFWVAPINTVLLLLVFLWMSWREWPKEEPQA